MADETLQGRDPTIRERMAREAQRAMEMAGVNRYGARTAAQSVMGGDSSNFPGGVGIADFAPFLGNALAAEEGLHELSDAYKAAQRGDFLGAAGNTAAAVAGLIPGAPGTIKLGKAAIKKIKGMELPKLKPIDTDSVPKKQSLREWAMAGGGVPLSYKDRPHVWHKRVQKLAAGGEVFNTTPDISDGGQIIDSPAFAGGGGVKKAVQGVVEGVKPIVDRLSMGFKDVTKRVPELADAAQRLAKGEMTAAEFDKLVQRYKPVSPYGFVPKPASAEEAMSALTESKRGQYGKAADIPAGERAELRLDIPAYTTRGVWVNSIHRPQTKQPTAYGSTSSARNVEMILPEEKALKVAQGGAKSPFAVMRGEWNPMSEADAVARSQEFLSHPDWAQIGMDPERHSYFYDRRTMQPVRSAEEVIQIGPLVLANKPQYGKKGDYKYAQGGDVHMAKGGGVKDLVQGAIEGGVKLGKRLLGKNEAPKGVEPIVVRTPEERELKGAMRPPVEPVRGQTSKELRAMQREQLSPEQKEKLSALKSQYPDFAKASRFMMPNEISKIIENPRGVREMNSLLQVIPNAKEMASVAKTGEAKRGWYRASTQAIMNVFGDDAPRFSSLLAALSPQNSVETNLLNTLNTWKNWTAAGRPTDDRSIREILGRSVQGTKGEDSVLEAWAQNAIRSLSAQDPTKVVLSGAKVDSFWRNLADDVYRVTNDAWMANGMGIQQKLFGQKPTELQLLRGDPGLTPGYIGASARTREAGEMANMLPSEAQETTWSTFLPLYELQEKFNLPAREILQRGMLTPEVIRQTPDFSTLFHNPTYGRILEQSGYGEQLAGLKPHVWPEARIDLSLSEQRDLERAARRLEDLRSSRNMETRSKTISLPSEGSATRAYPYETAEYIPMRGAGHAEDIIDAPLGQRQSFSSKVAGAFTDFSGKDVLHGALGLPGLKTASGVGAYRPPGKYPWMRMPMENQPMFAIGVESPVTSSMNLPKRTQDKMTAAAALRGAMTGQGGQSYNVQIPDARGGSLFVPLDKKVGADEMNISAQLLPDNVYLADTGRGVSVINYGNNFDDQQAKLIAQRLGGSEFIPTTTRGNYIDYSGDWMQPQGSGAVTRKMFSNLESLSENDLKSLSEAAQVPASKVYDAYRSLEASKGYVLREDLMRLLSILRDKGIPGVAAALAAGEALPAEPEQPKRAGGLASLQKSGGRA